MLTLPTLIYGVQSEILFSTWTREIEEVRDSWLTAAAITSTSTFSKVESNYCMYLIEAPRRFHPFQ